MLSYIHISQAADDIVKYIKERHLGTTRSLKTRWDKFNNTCMGGIEPNAIYTFAGVSGSGKSSFLNSLETDLFTCNPHEEFVILSFNFEMLSSRQVGRKISSKLNKTTQQLYSGLSQEVLSEDDIIRVEAEANKFKKLPIYYIDLPGTVDEIRETVLNFSQLDFVKNKWLLIFLDHTLLTKGRSGEKEREILASLQYMFMELKKFDRNTIIQLSQLNRDIESTERLNNSSMHFPTRKDIFGGESVFQASDYVVVLHRPELLHLKTYGPANWLVADLVYMHFLKNREGDLKILEFKNHLKHNRIEEYDSSESKQNLLQLF